MLKLPMIQVDAFTTQPFKGNPAAVCVTDQWLDESLMQAIAMENNLAETAFCVPLSADQPERYGLRWFTPSAEVDLCGHATLAAAHGLWTHWGVSTERLVFDSRSGPLTVQRTAEGMGMDFPAVPSQRIEAPEGLIEGLGVRPSAVAMGTDCLAVLDSAEAVCAVQPDFSLLAKVPGRGVIITAAQMQPERRLVSRCFYPKLSVPEDPVTGSAHCQLVPFWGERLGHRDWSAHQASARGGDLHGEWINDRVQLTGQAVTVMVAELQLPARFASA